MATLSQAQVEQWIAQNGGPTALQYGVEKKQVRNPEYDPINNPLVPQYVDIEVEVWKNAKTGASLTVRRQPDGNLEQIENVGADPNKPAGGENSPSARRTAREEAEIAANAALPPDQDPRPETNAERAERAERTRKEQEAKAEAARKADDSTVVSVTYEGKGRDRKKVTAYKSGRKVTEDAPTNASPVSVSYDQDGTKVTKYDDGSETREQLSPAQRRAEQAASQVKEERTPVAGKDGRQYTKVTKQDPATGKTETWYENDKGERVSLPSDDMPGAKNAPSFTPDLTKPGAGIVDRAKELDELLAAGKITWTERQRILESDIALARQVSSDFNSAVTLLREQAQSDLTQRGQDISQANSRASLANTHHQNAIGVIEKFAPYLGVTPGDAGKMFMGMMASQLATATAYGGMQDAPRVQMDPRLGAFVDRTLAGPQAAPATVPPGPGEAPSADPQAAARAEAEAVRQAHRASGQPLPAPIFAPAPVTAPVQQAGNIPPGMMSPNPPDMTQTTAPATPQPTPGFIEQVDWGTTPSPQAMATGEALFGKTLPEPQSWRQGAEQQAFALTMPQQQQAGVGEALFGGSLPQWQAPAMPDYSLPPIQGAGGMDPIDAEARRQLAAAGVLV